MKGGEIENHLVKYTVLVFILEPCLSSSLMLINEDLISIHTLHTHRFLVWVVHKKMEFSNIFLHLDSLVQQQLSSGEDIRMAFSQNRNKKPQR